MAEAADNSEGLLVGEIAMASQDPLPTSGKNLTTCTICFIDG